MTQKIQIYCTYLQPASARILKSALHVTGVSNKLHGPVPTVDAGTTARGTSKHDHTSTKTAEQTFLISKFRNKRSKQGEREGGGVRPRSASRLETASLPLHEAAALSFHRNVFLLQHSLSLRISSFPSLGSRLSRGRKALSLEKEPCGLIHSLLSISDPVRVRARRCRSSFHRCDTASLYDEHCPG